MGHEVWTEDRRENSYSPLRRIVRSDIIRSLLGLTRYLTPTEKSEIGKYTDLFISKNITTTTAINSTNKQALEPYQFEGYIVGSDQVWRKDYSLGIENYFLDFASENSLKIAYGASFGISEWEYNASQTRRLSALAQRFNLISVRESDGIKLCREHLHVDAKIVLDPTMLLLRDDYEALAKDTMGVNTPQGGLTCYLLDKRDAKQKIVETIANNRSLAIADISPANSQNTHDGRPVSERVVAPVGVWLAGLINSEFIITDSFHGALFAILFNKPFIVITNEERGASRFKTLLSHFDLEERLINIETFNLDLLNSSINFEQVNKKLEELRRDSLSLLRDSLSSAIAQPHIQKDI